MNTIFLRIDEVMIASFGEKMAKIAKIAGKLGVPAPTYALTYEFVKKMYSTGEEIVKRYFVEVNGVMPKIDGWTFVCKIDHTDRLAYGEMPAGFSVDVCKCDHCKSNRLRTVTYIITDGTEYKQVGGACLKNYLGHALPATMASYFDSVRDLDSEYTGTGSVPYYELKNMLAVTIGNVAENGYSKDMTKHAVLSLMANPRLYDQAAAYITTHIDEAQQIIDFVKSMDADSTYLQNIKQIATDGHVQSKAFGYACSMVLVWKRHNEEKAKAENAKESNHVGEVKDRLKNIKVRVTGVHVFEGYYGYTTFVNMADADGNQFTWKASGAKSFEANEEITITGTVAEHGEYKGAKVTYLTRCKVA